MIKHKDFLIRMCEVENVNASDLMALTGKSKTVVYEWLNYSNLTNFPTNDSLSKIICRLGITIDDFLKCKSDKLVDYNLYRSYTEYILGGITSSSIDTSITEAINYNYILNCFVDDCVKLKSMVRDYLNGNKINEDEFSLLCSSIRPYYWSDIVYLDELTDSIVDELNINTIRDFKDRTDIYNERIDDDPELEGTIVNEYYVPNANEVILNESLKDIDVLKKYINVLSDSEKNILLEHYLNKVLIDDKYDKKRKIFKLLVKTGCSVRTNIDNKLLTIYKVLYNSN